MIEIFSILFGFIIGSFSNCIIPRIKKGENFTTKRSYCPKCKNTLGVLDLIPVFSYLFLGGKCRFCKKSIGIRYFLVEIIFGTLFFFLFQSVSMESLDIFNFSLILFLFSSLLILSIYDILFLEVLDILAIYLFLIFFSLSFTKFGFVSFQDGFLGSFFIYTFFYLQIFLPGSFYFLKKKKSFLKIVELGYEYFLFILWVFLRAIFSEKFLGKFKIFKEEKQEFTAWIGGGDLRIALLIGFVLGWKLSILAIFLSYISGSIYSTIYLIYQKVLGKKADNKIPFIPFLAIGIFISFFFGKELLEIYFDFLLYS